jgi:excisionase family DNA binding protein
MAIPNRSPRLPVPPPSASADAERRLLLTLDQTALALAISKRTLERLIVGGSFPVPLKIGRSTRIPREDIADYLEQLRRQRGDTVGTS